MYKSEVSFCVHYIYELTNLKKKEDGNRKPIDKICIDWVYEIRLNSVNKAMHINKRM